MPYPVIIDTANVVATIEDNKPIDEIVFPFERHVESMPGKRAVDTAEIVRNRFVQNAKVKDIKIGTESITNEEGRTSNVSSMEIILTTKKKSK